MYSGENGTRAARAPATTRRRYSRPRTLSRRAMPYTAHDDGHPSPCTAWEEVRGVRGGRPAALVHQTAEAAMAPVDAGRSRRARVRHADVPRHALDPIRAHHRREAGWRTAASAAHLRAAVRTQTRTGTLARAARPAP